MVKGANRIVGGAPSLNLGKEAGLTENGILPQIEVAFAQHNLMTTPRGACPRSVKKTRGIMMTVRKLLVAEKGARAHAHALEALHHPLAQRFERTPRVCTDGPFHLCVIGDYYHIMKKKKISVVVFCFIFHAGGEAKGT